MAAEVACTSGGILDVILDDLEAVAVVVCQSGMGPLWRQEGADELGSTVS